MIYGYVLGGKTLHCRLCTGRNVRLSVICEECHLSDIHGRDYKRFIALAVEKDYFEKHKPGYCNVRHVAARFRNLFSLPKVCQQLYSETALLPLRTSTICFRDSEILRLFVYALLPMQQRAIRKAIISVPCSRRTERNWAIPLAYLTSLSELSYHCHVHFARRESDIISEQTLEILEELPLREVNIRVGYNFMTPPWYMVEDVETRTKEAEERILRSCSLAGAGDGSSTGRYGLSVFGL